MGTEVVAMGGALLLAGAYITYLHREIKLYQRDVAILQMLFTRVAKDMEARDDED